MKALCEFAECSREAGDPNDQDEQSLRRPRAPDPLAFRELVEQLQSKVFSVSYALLGDTREADEAAQKVFVRLYRTAGAVNRQRDCTTWVYKLAVEQCLSELRLRRVRKLLHALTRRASTSERIGLRRVVENGDRDLVVRSLSALPDIERTVLVLKEVAGQPVECIAEILHMSSGAVRRRLFKARKNLRTAWPASAGT